MSSKGKTVVPRAGYYLGYRLAQELGKTRSLTELAQPKPNEILPLLRKTIETVRQRL
jgi:hypothetical protein